MSETSDQSSGAGKYAITGVGVHPGMTTVNGKVQTDKRTLRDVISKKLSQQSASGSTVKLIGLNITSIPDADVELLKNVERLSLRKNLLIHLPSNFCTLKGLRYLDLDNNILQEIPPVLMQCPKLEILDLSYNNIEVLPQDVSPLWSQQLKVLSLKSNNVSSIWGLKFITKCENLRVLEILGNPIPNEELEAVRLYTPMTPDIVKEEYWAIAIRRFLQDHSSPFEATHDPRILKAAKRMGFIGTTSPASAETVSSVSPSPVAAQHASSDADTSYNTSETTSNELYNHSKFNDYFKRLSILPEESLSNEHLKVSHDELLVACRKLLFSFTECQQNVRKIASFCKEKAVAVNVVSLLYSVRSHIDNLIGLLEQAESEEKSNDAALIKLCITIISIFKQIISQLRKNFKTFFEADDLCFIRMFYMTLICSYTEIYNAWCFIGAEDARISRKRQLSRAQSAINLSAASASTTTTGPSTVYLPRTRSNTLQARVAPLGVSSGPAVSSSIEVSLNGYGFNGIKSPPLATTSPSQSISTQSAAAVTPPSSTSMTHSLPQQAVDPVFADGSPRQPNSHSPRPHKAVDGHAVSGRDGTEPETNSPSSSSINNVDAQLYQTLGTVIVMVNVVYDQLTSEISKAAMASTTGQQELTDALLSKIRDLTDTCCQAMELSKILNERLHLLTTDAGTSEKYLSTAGKVKTWENINAFLKSIISILANTKLVMADMPALNEIRPNLASLAKITKDVTVILDLSSYKGVSVLAAQLQGQNSSQTQPQAHQLNQQPQSQSQHVAGGVDEKFYSFVSTPQLTPANSHSINPFDA